MKDNAECISDLCWDLDKKTKEEQETKRLTPSKPFLKYDKQRNNGGTKNTSPPPFSISNKESQAVNELLTGLDDVGCEEKEPKKKEWKETKETKHYNSKKKIGGYPVLTYDPPVEPYIVTFFLATDINMMDIPFSVGDWDRGEAGQVIAIATLTEAKRNGTPPTPNPNQNQKPQLRIYVCDEVQAMDAQMKFNGWIAEFGQLMDGASGICCFGELGQYALLRKHLEFEQRMIYWRMTTFDVWGYIKKTTRQWAGLRDLLTANHVTDCPTHATAASQFFNERDVLNLARNLENQVRGIARLTEIIAKSPTHSLRYPIKKNRVIVKIDTLSLDAPFQRVYGSNRCAFLYE